ncbi:MAG: diphthamide biosynthesis enzyme Dph2 [Candidatus Diapherotrites archaeon]|uniref:2-(3-amino-3-carboxypropyl)histidine synthase n=1 Tax=Candidatus Iainarchaeum sp. TaxID=3101447 RepID=A0A8T3YJC0_9ARCH|nr:diphthamide biosynthesis enzyme Dph2 [Candidatus Diapherotrites archaeon]
MPELIVDLAEARKFLQEKGAGTCIVQIPEGLKGKTTWIIDELKGSCDNVFVKMDPCYGACDLPLHDMKALNADAIIHIGHGPIHRNKNILYITCRYDLSEQEIRENANRLLKELGKRGARNIALIANAQYQHALPALKKILFENGIAAHIGAGTSRIASEGQVLGCNYTVVESIQAGIDANVYFGDGHFHPQGLVFSTTKPVIAVNPLHGTVEEISEKNRDRLMRKRFAAVAKASEAKSFGIILSVKSGQRQKEKALELKKAIERAGRKAYLLEMDLVVESYMAGVKVDCLVNTACNRIVLDDAENWKRLIINPTECLIAIGEKKWEEWKPDEFLH